MKLLSIQVGKIQTHDYQGEAWTTAYKKKPVDGAVFVNRLHVEGDEQYNKKHHGGEHRAVLMYCVEHYQKWAEEFNSELPHGSFAENFTVAGLDEQSVCIGDIYQVGDTVRLQVSQPRVPCYQIHRSLGIDDITAIATALTRTGWYLCVLQEGQVEAGMPITLLERLYPDWTIYRAHDVMSNRKDKQKEAAELSSIVELEPGWRERLEKSIKS
jgi:MOSC domain-containing protein YiiM